jgi:hypothetical protein
MIISFTVDLHLHAIIKSNPTETKKLIVQERTCQLYPAILANNLY